MASQCLFEGGEARTDPVRITQEGGADKGRMEADGHRGDIAGIQPALGDPDRSLGKAVDEFDGIEPDAALFLRGSC